MSEAEGSSPVFLEAGRVAKQLGVSSSGMRRLAVIYEEVHGDLPRKGPKDTDARLFPPNAVERLAAARQMVEAERFGSIKEALEALEAGVRPDITIADTLDTAARDLSGEALGLLLEELRGMRSELAELRPVRREVQALREEIATLKALPPAESVQPVTERAADQEARHGPLVRLALWFESRFRG